MQLMLSDDLWHEVAKRAATHSRLRAAIAYVTAGHLEFKDNDVLVCDASDEAIIGGQTAASQLQKFLDAGADVYSYQGLHSKIAVFDSFALIGSANLSARAGVGTLEASLLTDDPQVLALALGFIEKVRQESVPVTPEFMRRIRLLPVTPRHAITRKSRKKISVGESRVWFVATRPLSERTVASEAAFEAAGMEEAMKRARPVGYETEAIRWSGKSTFRSEAKAGDLLIQAYTYLGGTRKFTQVYPPAPVIHRQDEQSWTRFYVEYPLDEGMYRWPYVEAQFRSLGVKNISRESTRELTGAGLGILRLID